jgi:hypothetical protein
MNRTSRTNLVSGSVFAWKEVIESLCNSENVLFSGGDNSVSSIGTIKLKLSH